MKCQGLNYSSFFLGFLEFRIQILMKFFNSLHFPPISSENQAYFAFVCLSSTCFHSVDVFWLWPDFLSAGPLQLQFQPILPLLHTFKRNFCVVWGSNWVEVNQWSTSEITMRDSSLVGGGGICKQSLPTALYVLVSVFTLPDKKKVIIGGHKFSAHNLSRSTACFLILSLYQACQLTTVVTAFQKGVLTGE